MPKLRVLQYPSMDPPQDYLRTLALFFDTIGSVVPGGEIKHLSPATQEFADKFPDAFRPVAPPHDLGQLFDASVVTLLDAAFQSIAQDRGRRIPGITKLKAPSGRNIITSDLVTTANGTRVRDSVFVHDEKISPAVRDLLHKHNLVHPSDFAKMNGYYRDDFAIVEERACDLILSHIADSVAAAEGWDTVTASELDFAFCGASRATVSDHPERHTALAAALISSVVPAGLDRLDIKSYAALRDAYADVRRPFDRMARELAVDGRISTITDPAAFRQRLDEIVREFEAEVAKAQKSRWWQRIEAWAPFCVSSLLSVGGAIFGPTVGISCAVGGVAVVFVEKALDYKPHEPLRDVYRPIGEP